MSLLDWLGGGKDTVSYVQTPEQQQVYAALLPLLQRLGVSGGATGANQKAIMQKYNQGMNPVSGRPLSQRTYNLPTSRQPYQRSATGSNTTQLLALANINKRRVEQGLKPITMDQLRMNQSGRG